MPYDESFRPGDRHPAEGHHGRAEILALVPSDTTSLLDVGCATGAFGTSVREAFPMMRLWGIDVDDRGVDSDYDRVIVGRFPHDVPHSSFDCITFNDVLEHMYDPWGALERAKTMLNRSGVVIASIPNVRNVRVTMPLLLHGDWQYRGSGLLDADHVRFFTRSSIATMFRQTGYTIDRLEPIRSMSEGRWALANRLFGNRLVDFVAERFAVVAHPREIPTGSWMASRATPQTPDAPSLTS